MHETVVRRKSIALRELIDSIQHDVLLAIEDAKLVCVSHGQRDVVADGVDVEIRMYPATEMSQGTVERLEPAASGGVTSYYVLVCDKTVVNLTSKCIVVKHSDAMFAILLPSRFLEIHLHADTEPEEVELLDELLRDYAELRIKGSRPPKGRVPVALTPEGKPLEDGIGDIVGSEIRAAAHFLAKRITENRGKLCDEVRHLSRFAKKVFERCPPGAELRIQQGTIDNLKRAELVCTNAVRSINDNKGLLRGVSKQVGSAVGDELQESPLGQQLAQHRGAREARRIALAAMDGSDELFTATSRLPEQLLKAVFDAALDVIGHIWGDRAVDAGRHSLGMLSDFLAIKWSMEWAFPSSLALAGLKALLQAGCDNPSTKVLEHIEAKKDRQKAEDELRDKILKER